MTRSPISTHAPRAGSDLDLLVVDYLQLLFQPTLPVRGATAVVEAPVQIRRISTHAPRAGSDARPWGVSREARYFNPRSPCGERLIAVLRTTPASYFNPRSPCGERHGSLSCNIRMHHFNPRSPCGERLCPECGRKMIEDFNPRSPCGERPEREKRSMRAFSISTHAPRAGSDAASASDCVDP